VNTARIAILLAVVFLTASVEVLAQQSPAGDAAAKSLCFAGRPREYCSSFLLTQARVQYRLSPATADPVRWYVTADIGWMKNISRRDALGVSVFGGPEIGFEEAQYGLRGRYRRWVGERSSIDVSMGAVFGTTYDIGAPGFSGILDYTISDLFLASFGVDYANTSSCALHEDMFDSSCETKYVGRTYLGVGLGSKLGLAAYAVGGVVGLLAALYATSSF
jgi:hypothetical protein